MGDVNIPVEQVQVGATHTTRVHLHEDLAGTRVGRLDLGEAQHAWTLDLYRAHLVIMPAGPIVTSSRHHGVCVAACNDDRAGDRGDTDNMTNRAAFLLSGLAVIALVLAGCGKSSSSTTGSSTGKPASTASTAATTSKSASTASTTTAQPSTTSTSASTTPTSATVTVAPATASTLVVSGTAGGTVATLHASTHTPTVGRPWPLRFTVTRGRAPAKAAVQYEYLFGGQVVARRSHYTFTGHFSDVFQWPSTAVGYPLTFRAVVLSEGATINLDYPVQVTG
jgi:hypothetical protein